MSSMNQANRWMDNKDLQNFVRQAHLDMHVGLKNGLPEQELLQTIHDFLASLENQLRLSRMERQADGSWKERQL